jgi:hypothetical protein
LKWFKQTGSLWLVGIIAYAVFMIAQLPAKMLWRWAEPYVVSPLRISSVEGVWWQGSARWIFPGYQLDGIDLGGKVRWNLAFSSLLSGHLGAHIQLESTYFKAKTFAKVGASKKLTLEDLTLLVDAAIANAQLTAVNAKVQGNLELRPSQAVIDLSSLASAQFSTAAIEKLQGEVVWLGGEANYPVGSEMRQSDIPILLGQLQRSEEGSILLKVTDEAGQLALEGYVKTDGWAGIAVKRHFFDVIGEQWLGGSEPEAIVFEVSEKVY